jgi:subtilisin family serine protease
LAPSFPSLLALLSIVLVQDPGTRSYTRDGSTWSRTDSHGDGAGVTWQVDPREISVRFRAPIADLSDFESRLDADADARLHALEALRSNKLGIHDLRVPEGADVLEVVAALRATGLVEFAEENTIGSWLGDANDPLFPVQWALKNTGQTGGVPDADIDADLAWDITVGDPSIVIAVIDSGVEVNHEDLIGGMWRNPGEVPNNSLDDESNGFVDDYDGWDFFNNSPGVNGPQAHGTFVAGLMVAQSNDFKGVASVAGGSGATDGCRAMPLQVGDIAPLASVIDDAIVYAVENGARVINISFAIGQSQAIDDAIAYAHGHGVFLAAAAGNTPATVVLYPASHPLVISVPATTHEDLPAPTSVSGSKNWVAAPGKDVTSTTLTANGKYATLTGGTSYAAPHVSALAGLCLSLLPSLLPDEIKEILRITADDIHAPGFDEATGWGRINALRAVHHVSKSDCNGNGIYDPREILQGTVPDNNANGIPDGCEIFTYCTAKTNSLNCVPAIARQGTPSASSQSGFLIRCSQVRNNKPGLLFYGVNGRNSSPFQGGLLCVQAPLRRTPISNAGGTPPPTADCSGNYSFDMALYASGAIGGNPLPALVVPGTRVNCQWWGRDQGFPMPNNTMLSNGLEYIVLP